MAPADAIGIILTMCEQGGALAFKLCFLGRICKDLGAAGASGGEEESAGVSILSIDSLYTDGEFEPICVVYSWLSRLLQSRGGWRKSPPHTKTSTVKTGARMILPFFRKG